MLRTPTVSLARTGLRAAQQATVIRRAATTHAISNPTLANIEKRWEGMPLQEQAELWMALRDRMKGPWSELTLQEKKAAYWIAFGPHGPRAGTPAGETSRVFWGVVASVGASLAIFATIRAFAGAPPDTMTKEYQEASNEFLKNQNSDPLTGISSEGYSGKGMVQSPPKAN
ncbi:cytochrome c oxidase polypeptide 5, mitochondrial [Colletotrichum liriopes]|uniref:Cytochrome c oxidase polypeptide V n=1 Tax=Colletotrichum liriopes TaxID=708192 RepID=A0AA37GJQ0_9PEZI|nr:cytochrome c oxidase polypeptide 5, mitochondrial [Colletotrichum liriopes]